MLDVATGMSMHLGAGLTVAARTDESAAELLRRFVLVEMAHQHLQSGDAEGADGLVRTLDVSGLPNRLRASRELVMGGVELSRGRPARALPHYELAASIDAEAPITDYLRAVALNRVGRHDEALPLARSFVKRMGGDADARAEEALALAALGQKREALAAARAGLDGDAGSAACLIELGVLLEAPDRRELTSRLLRLEDPVLGVAMVVPDLIERRAFGAALAAIAAITEASPRDPEADYWAGEVALARGRPAEAARLFARALPRVANDEDKTVFQEAYLEAMLALKEPLRGYAQFAGSAFAFEYLADALVEKGDATSLRDLVSVHRKYAADDAWLSYFAGQAFELAGERERAESVYADAMGKLTDADLLEEYRLARVRNLRLAGDAMDAYARIPPRRATFDQLAQAAVWDADWNLLTRLTRAHEQEDPGDPTIDFWKAEADAIGERYDAAVAKLISRREYLAQTRIGAERVVDRIVRYLARLGKFAEALSEARQATARGGDPFLEAVVQAWRDDAVQLAAAIDAGLDYGHDVRDYYDDPDIGPRLSERDKLRAARDLFPDPDADER
jgi:hypothetical protein